MFTAYCQHNVVCLISVKLYILQPTARCTLFGYLIVLSCYWIGAKQHGELEGWVPCNSKDFLICFSKYCETSKPTFEKLKKIKLDRRHISQAQILVFVTVDFFYVVIVKYYRNYFPHLRQESKNETSGGEK